MAVVLVTYDLRAPGRNYDPVFTYLKRFTHCKGMESVWLLDTTTSTGQIRDALQALVDANDRIFVTRLAQDWASVNYTCGTWLNDSARSW